MTKVLITRSKLDELANTVSAKSGAALPLTIAQMDAAVRSIVTGPDGDPLLYGTNTSSRINVAQADHAIVQDYTGTRTGRAMAGLAVLGE